MRFLPLLGFLALFVVVGCSGEPTRLPISGSVKVGGVPAGFATVRFIPSGPNADPMYGSIIPCDDKGEFILGSDGKNTGLPPGQYKVSFSQTLINGKPSNAGSGGKKGERLAGETDGIPALYRDPEKTPELVTVSSSSKSFQFDLKK